eukprot:365088-Chlamydomonas_euryale.AAC.2
MPTRLCGERGKEVTVGAAIEAKSGRCLLGTGQYKTTRSGGAPCWPSLSVRRWCEVCGSKLHPRWVGTTATQRGQKHSPLHVSKSQLVSTRGGRISQPSQASPTVASR